MKERFEDSFFAQLYLWVSKAKYTMGIFFVAFVILYLFLGQITSDVIMTLDLFTAFEMMFACFFIGLLQQFIVPEGKLSTLRATVWIVLSTIITVSYGITFHWFEHMPTWTFVFFLIAIVLGMIAAILSYYLDLHRETKAMNQKLELFKKQRKED